MIYINDIPIEEKSFPDGTPLLKLNNIQPPTLGRRVEFKWKYDHDGELFRLICLRHHYRNCAPDLYIPYVPNARQDRVKTSNDVFTLKAFAEIINNLNFLNVNALDVHSDVTAALFNNFHHISPYAYITQTIDNLLDTPVLFYPDSGAAKRYSDRLLMPYAYGIKNRDWQTGEIKSLSVADNGIDLRDKTILIVDDICSRGGTFFHSAKKLKELGADKIYLYVTHCENTILEGDLLKDNLVEHVFTTDSIFRKSHEKIEVFQI
ncbi:MAG: ribose-phosphate pyrophosphokinase [Bacteroidales bacterium]|nr:ribose-phosphate pyrophosphokinase [Bacteroidales bacterium]